MVLAQHLPVCPSSSSTLTNGTEKLPIMVRQATIRDLQQTVDLLRLGHEEVHIDTRLDARSNAPSRLRLFIGLIDDSTNTGGSADCHDHLQQPVI